MHVKVSRGFRPKGLLLYGAFAVTSTFIGEVKTKKLVCLGHFTRRPTESNVTSVLVSFFSPIQRDGSPNKKYTLAPKIFKQTS